MFRVGDHCPEDGTRLVKIKAVIDPLLGRVLDGRYTIIEKLGQGGMGAVYRASQHSVGREVAIKVVNAHLVSDHDAIRRFLREAKIASRLSHPNAVAVLDFGQSDDGLFYLVMELVSGRTLDQVLKAEGTLRPERVVRIGTQVCDALEGAHALQIVHRDLKPTNIMLLAQGRDHAKVLDFGLAKSLAPDTAATTMTNAGALLGTPAFMSPELALGQQCDGRADLYALGCILYLIGSGRLPFTYESAHELIAAHGHERAPPMTGVPPLLAAVIDRLLEKEPNRRYQCAADTREALEASLGQRMQTPLPFAADTSPSLGPFVATSEQFNHLRDTPMPRRTSTPEMEKLASSDTVVANAMTTIAETPQRRRWVVPILAAFAIAGAGLVALYAMRGEDEPAPATSEPAEPAATTQPAGVTPEVDKTVDKAVVAPVDKPVVNPVVPTAADSKPPETKPAVTKTQTKPAITKMQTKAAVTKTKTKPVTTKPTITKPVTTTTTKPPTPPAGKGSGTQMPF